MIPLLKDNFAGKGDDRMKVYHTVAGKQMDMGMYMCGMCMCFGVDFSDQPSHPFTLPSGTDR